jgi:hypothetical protein
MFDADYFKSDLIQQVQQLGAGACSVALHLTDGTAYRIHSYDPQSAKAGYVMLAVYPEDGVTEESKAKRRKPGGTDEVFYDRVAVPYEYITRVLLSVVEPANERRIIGFAARG